MSMKIKKYDKIEIINPGKLYSSYRLMAEKMQLQYFEYDYRQGVIKGATGKVIAVGNTQQSNKKIYGIRLDSIKRDIIMGYDGVSLYKSNILSIEDDLFRI